MKCTDKTCTRRVGRVHHHPCMVLCGRAPRCQKTAETSAGKHGAWIKTLGYGPSCKPSVARSKGQCCGPDASTFPSRRCTWKMALQMEICAKRRSKVLQTRWLDLANDDTARHLQGRRMPHPYKSREGPAECSARGTKLRSLLTRQRGRTLYQYSVPDISRVP